MKCQIYDDSYCSRKMQHELKNEQLSDGLIARSMVEQSAMQLHDQGL